MPDVNKMEICSVCNMKVDTKTGIKDEYKGKTYYFCSEGDKNKFRMNPEKYATRAA